MRRDPKVLCALIVAAFLGVGLAVPLYFEDFSRPEWATSFVKSSDEKYTGDLFTEIPEGLESPALKVPEKAKYYGYAANVGTPIDPSKGLVLQFELKLADSLTCGGAYLKFLTASAEFDAAGLKEETPYVVMFGPDKCGSTNKVHLIIKHRAPSGDIEEKHLKLPPSVLLDSDTHVYTAVLQPSDNTYQVLIDGEIRKSGSLFDDFEPPFNPPEEIDDPSAKKPENWVDAARIPDPDAVKPEDWDEDAAKEIEDSDAEKPEGWLDDEPAEVDDPEAERPEDWEEEEDGKWEPPQIANPKCTQGPGCGTWKRPKIPNPAYKGKWSAPYIDNPDYKGPWAPPKIANPQYYVDEQPLKNIGRVGGVALEIWTMDQNYYFSDILIDNDPLVAEQYRQRYWQPKQAIEAKLAEEKKAKEPKLDEEGSHDGGVVVKVIRDAISSLLDLPGVSALRGPLQPIIGLIEDSPVAAVAAAGALLAVPLFVLIQLIPKGQKTAVQGRKAVQEAKKEDKTGPDDKLTPAAVSRPVSEIVEEDEDEDDAKKSTKRRVRRDA